MVELLGFKNDAIQTSVYFVPENSQVQLKIPKNKVLGMWLSDYHKDLDYRYIIKVLDDADFPMYYKICHWDYKHISEQGLTCTTLSETELIYLVLIDMLGFYNVDTNNIELEDVDDIIDIETINSQLLQKVKIGIPYIQYEMRNYLRGLYLDAGEKVPPFNLGTLHKKIFYYCKYNSWLLENIFASDAYIMQYRKMCVG